MGALFHLPIQEYFDKYKPSIFVETGTGTGSCLNYARTFPFEKLYSIEIEKDFVDKLKYIEKEDSRVKLINDFSVDALSNVIKELPKNQGVMWWLDGHFPGADFQKISYQESLQKYESNALPLGDELSIITALRDFSRDIFLIDDYFIYAGDKLTEWSRNHPFVYRELATELGIDLNPKTIEDFFQESHVLETVVIDQGYLLCFPKN